MENEVAVAIALVVGIGVAVSPFVFAAVTIARGIVGKARARRVTLPLVGIACGCLFTALVLAVLEMPPSGKNAAIVLLAGFWANAVSAGLNAQGKEARGG